MAYRLTLLSALTALPLWLASGAAVAGPVIITEVKLTEGTLTHTYTDGGNSTNSGSGTVTGFPATFGTFTLSGFNAQGILGIGTSAAPEQILNFSGTAKCTASCSTSTLTIAITEIGLSFKPPAYAEIDYANSYTGLASGTTVTNASYISVTNVAFGKGTAVTMSPTGYSNPPDINGDGDAAGTYTNFVSAPFSITNVMTLKEGTNKGAELTFSADTTPPVFTPEPASLAVLGAALTGLGLVRRHRKD